MCKYYVCNLLYIFIAPEGPPENLRSDRRIDSVTFEWMPPSCPNGIIQRYQFSITMENGTYSRELCANQTTMTVDGFNPYEPYTVEVSASTRVNGNLLDGSPAVLVERTLPDSELSSQQCKHAQTMHFRVILYRNSGNFCFTYFPTFNFHCNILFMISIGHKCLL